MKPTLTVSRRVCVSLLVCLLAPAPALAEPAGAAVSPPHHGLGAWQARAAMHDDRKRRRHGLGRGVPRAVRVSSMGIHQEALTLLNALLKFKDGLLLTDNQAQGLQRLKMQYLKTWITIKATMQLAAMDLSALLKDDQARLATIEAQVHALHALKEKMDLAAIKVTYRARALLSAEQKIRLKTLHEHIKAHGGSLMRRS